MSAIPPLLSTPSSRGPELRTAPSGQPGLEPADDARGAADSGAGGAARSVGGRPAAKPVGGAAAADAVQQAAARMVEAYAHERDLAVDSRYDERTDRPVWRIADRRTGEVLFESPPEELLRFFASMREPPGAPLVALEA